MVLHPNLWLTASTLPPTSDSTSFERPELICGLVGIPVNDPVERRLHRIDNRIAEREVFFLRSADGVFLAKIAYADGDIVRRHVRYLQSY